MKKAITIMLILLLCAAAYAQNTAPNTAANTPAPGTYNVDFKKTSMKEFIATVASFVNTNIVYKETDLKGDVTIESPYPVSEHAIMQMFHSALAVNGLLAIQQDGYIQIVPDRDLQVIAEPFETNPTGEQLITTIIVLKNYNATAIAQILNRVKSKYGVVEQIRGLNGLIIRDFGSHIEKMRQMCNVMDRYAGDFQIQSFTLENIKATRAQQLIAQFFGELLKNQLVAQLPMMISDDLANVLIIAASKDDYSKVQQIISQIDVSNPESTTLPQIYRLRYASAEDVEKVINKLIVGIQPAQPQGAVGGPPVKSQISSDKTTNSIIAMGDQNVYANIARMIEQLDIPRKQVHVEALILETSLDDNSNFGVEWFGAGAEKDLLGYAASGAGGGLANLLGAATGSAGALTAIPAGFSAGLIGDVITYKGTQYASLGGFMSAIAGDAGVNIVSNPQVTVLDNDEGEVFIGENRPYVTSEKFDSNNNPIQTFEYKDVGIRLKVTPHIAGDEMVNLDIDMEVNTFSPTASVSASSPVTLTRTTKTKVQLYDRSIMIISGLMKDDSSVTDSGVPFLRKIPILGWLFKSQVKQSSKTNLMIFLNTYIINNREDMDEIMQRRVYGNTQFQEKAAGNTKSVLNPEDSFIPMQQDVNRILEGSAPQAGE